MQYQLLKSETEMKYAVVFEVGDEFSQGMLALAEDQNMMGAHFTAIGAFQKAVLGWFDPERQEYVKHRIDEQVEVLSLVGNIAEHQGKPKVHAHVVLGRHDASTCGGHLLEAYVRPTLEVIVTESPRHLHRLFDQASGLPLIRFDESPGAAPLLRPSDVEIG